MAQAYAEIPGPSTNERARGWIDDDFGDEFDLYQPSEADYEEMALAQLESAIDQQRIGIKYRLREQLDRIIRAYEQSQEQTVSVEPPPF